MKIYKLDNFVPTNICDQILENFIFQEKESDNGESFFDNRTIPYSKIKNVDLKKLVNVYRFESTFIARSIFKTNLYPEYTDLVYWKNGTSMSVHSDSFMLDGSPGKYPWRYATAVTYLNDDYEGGETYFPNFNYVSKPKKGTTLLFLTDLEHIHGVKETFGDRYTMPIWFTKNFNYIED